MVYINAHFSRQLPIGVPRKSRNALFRVFGHIFVVEKVKKGFKMSYLFLRAKISTWIGPNVQVYLKDIATVYLKKKKRYCYCYSFLIYQLQGLDLEANIWFFFSTY